ncbi:MAG: lipid A deacylase LpxR family protein [Sulfurimonas sp.]|uniref:lipid A deacylase LpxR family protein n=1 Tax=Sulfurimonas sp. TaxID=2022749 RepID=UPI0025DE7D87|nr:lipid A deacylase LpxR family protein [Sulfurimonas sp.]MCK9455502.1 lipid A deacylase LpxR family protein [Sulfurimonas sp.]
MMQRLKLVLLFFSLTLNADQVSFSFYNDVFAGTDRHFTNGISFSWLDDTYRASHNDNNKSSSYSNFTGKIVETLPFISPDRVKNYNAGISISQIMITPKDISVTTPQYNDLPYVGHLVLSFFMFEWDEKSFTEYRIESGVVGKESGTKFVQNIAHKFVSDTETKGWDTQLGTKYTINTLFRFGEISWEKNNINWLSMDWFNHFGVQAGNFMIDAFGGTMFRIGDNYARSFNLHYPYLKEEASLLRLDKKHEDDLGWSLSIGANGSLMAYSYILDEAKKEGYATDKNIINISLYAGADLYYDVHKLTFFYQTQPHYTTQQKKIDIFGGLVYSFQF